MDDFKNAFAPLLDQNGNQIELGDLILYHSKREGWLVARITQLKIVQKINWDDSVSLRRTIRVHLKGKPRWDSRTLYRVDRVEKIFDVD